MVKLNYVHNYNLALTCSSREHIGRRYLQTGLIALSLHNLLFGILFSTAKESSREVGNFIEKTLTAHANAVSKICLSVC